jgi:hypothetical protein
MTFGSLAAPALALLAVSCGGNTATITEITGPDIVRCATTVSSQQQSFPSAGSRVTVNVVAARECSWTANSDASWAQVTPSSGQGEAAVTVTVAANPDARTRSGSVAINETRLSLTQEAAPCRFELGSAEVRMSSDGGQTAVGVTANGGCDWRVTSEVSWVRVLTDSGSGTGRVELDVSANSGSERSGDVRIADRSVRIVQSGRATPPSPGPTPPPPGPPSPPNPPNPPNPPPNPTCSFSLDSGDRSFGASGGEGSFRVTTSGGCNWSASSNQQWVEVTGRSSGSGSETISYRVRENSSTSSRSGAITVAGQTHNVRQDGAAPPPPPPPRDERVSFSGRAFFVDGSCPSLSFFVDFRRVVTNGDTKFKGGGCQAIRSGAEVSGEGRASDGRVVATEIDVRGRD